MKSVYNGVGSRKRNTPPGKQTVGKSYGFAHDMRERFNKRYRAFYAKVERNNPRATWRSISRAFYSEPRAFVTRYYGSWYTMRLVYPYVVVTDDFNGWVAAVFPAHASQVLVHAYDARRPK